MCVCVYALKLEKKSTKLTKLKDHGQDFVKVYGYVQELRTMKQMYVHIPCYGLI